MIKVELEKTYLAKTVPTDLAAYPHKEILDIYIPESAVHPTLRLRKKGDSYEMTKKSPDEAGDSSKQTEHTIKLTREEFESLETIQGRHLKKIRYDYPYKGFKAEITVFQDDLKGLVLVDVEFQTQKDLKAFAMPDFCLADVTDDETFAGGMLCGKRYEDIAGRLAEYGYAKIVP